jgi:hypothetical protein
VASASAYPVTYRSTATTNFAAVSDPMATTATVTPAPATLRLGNLAQTYSGLPEPVTVTTSPPGLSGVSVTYNGSSTAPTTAGSYSVVATLSNANYLAASATGTLTINPVPVPDAQRTSAPASPPLAIASFVAVRTRHGRMLAQMNLTFNIALDAASAESLAPYQLESADRNGMFGTPKDKSIRLKQAIYNTAGSSLVLTPAKPVSLNQPLKLIIDPSRGLRGTSGQPVSGSEQTSGLLSRIFGAPARTKHARH